MKPVPQRTTSCISHDQPILPENARYNVPDAKTYLHCDALAAGSENLDPIVLQLQEDTAAWAKGFAEVLSRSVPTSLPLRMHQHQCSPTVSQHFVLGCHSRSCQGFARYDVESGSSNFPCGPCNILSRRLLLSPQTFALSSQRLLSLSYHDEAMKVQCSY